MKTVLAALLVTATATATAFAQPAPEPAAPSEPPPAAPAIATTTAPAPAPSPAAAPAPVATATAPAPAADLTDQDDGWTRPVGRRFLHGFRLGWIYLYNYDKPTRSNGMSLKDEFDLRTPNMLLLGYEGFYRIIGHSWLNVLMVGNVTVAGLEQSKFIPAASGLIGFEFDKSFQLGVGINATPDTESPTHMIAAAGWTPHVGSIQTPVHFFFIPDTERNHRMGATVGMTW